MLLEKLVNISKIFSTCCFNSELFLHLSESSLENTNSNFKFKKHQDYESVIEIIIV